MTKEVLLSIVGLHYDTFAQEAEEETEPIEVITPAMYFLKNNKHYIVYDEFVEGMIGTIKTKIKITGDTMMEIMKSGITNTHMTFEKDKIHMTDYATPYGELLVGTYTKDMKVDVTEDVINVSIAYTLDANGEKVADCNIVVNVKANGKEKDRSE